MTSGKVVLNPKPPTMLNAHLPKSLQFSYKMHTRASLLGLDRRMNTFQAASKKIEVLQEALRMDPS